LEAEQALVAAVAAGVAITAAARSAAATNGARSSRVFMPPSLTLAVRECPLFIGDAVTGSIHQG
jgi:hypothetical protein